MYTVKQLAKMAGITPRTLHYYDEIGLLKPAQVGENSYRYYNDESLLRLQQILFYRELDLPLGDIKQALESSDFNLLYALESHKVQLLRRIEHLERLITTVDNTIQVMKGNKEMSKVSLFEGFNEEEEAKHEQEAMQMYDPETVKASYQKWRKYSAADKQRIAEEGNAVYESFLKAMPKGPASLEAQTAVAAWRKHMDYFWTPNEEQLLGISQGYNTDPRFKENFDRIDPNLAAFIGDAVEVYIRGR